MPKHSAESMPYRYDSRTDSGYGRTTNKFHSPRQANSQFPYIDPDPMEDIEVDDLDDDAIDAVNSKLKKYNRSDFGAHKSVNPFYFVAGNTKLSDCFFRTDEVLAEMHAVANSMVPFPRMYKARSAGLGAVDYHTVRPSSRIGNEAGYASAPEKIIDDEDDEELYSLEDLAAYLGLSPRHT